MKSSSRRIFGFTLIELMTTLAVMLVVMLLALPSFLSFRQRASLRGASEEVLSLWNDARFEAAKRNSNVKFGFVTAGTEFCVGAATTTDPADTTPCDCTEAAPVSEVCDIGRFPADQGEWNGVTLDAGSDLGNGNDVVVLDLKQLRLTDPATAGAISLNDPTGGEDYRVNVHIDQFGRGILCGSSAADVEDMSEYINRQCAP